MSLTGHAAVIGAWQLLERDDLGHRRHLQVTLCLLGRDDPGHRMTSLTGHSALIGAWRPRSLFLERDWLARAAKSL